MNPLTILKSIRISMAITLLLIATIVISGIYQNGEFLPMALIFGGVVILVSIIGSLILFKTKEILPVKNKKYVFQRPDNNTVAIINGKVISNWRKYYSHTPIIKRAKLNC